MAAYNKKRRGIEYRITPENICLSQMKWYKILLVQNVCSCYLCKKSALPMIFVSESLWSITYLHPNMGRETATTANWMSLFIRSREIISCFLILFLFGFSNSYWHCLLGLVVVPSKLLGLQWCIIKMNVLFCNIFYRRLWEW